MRLSIWTVFLSLLTSCNSPETPVVDLPEEIPFDDEAFDDLSDSIILQALYEVTGLTPFPDTIVSRGDTVFTAIQVLEHQPFNGPFTLTRIVGNKPDDEANLHRFLIEHDNGCSYPLIEYKGRRPFAPSCYLVLKKSSKKITRTEWGELLQLIQDTDLTELAYLPRRGNLLDGDHLTFKYLEADAFEYLDFSISRGAPGEKSSLRRVINHLNEL